MTIIGMVELRHRFVYGHFVPPTLHADVTSHPGYKPGRPSVKVYSAHLTNFSPIPRRIERCEFKTDSADEVSTGYRLERRNYPSRQWQITIDAAALYCQSHPRGVAPAPSRLVSSLLWPGQTLSTGSETAAERATHNGEIMRFVIMADRGGIPTRSFTITDYVEDDPAYLEQLELEVERLTALGTAMEDVISGLQGNGVAFSQYPNPTLLNPGERGLVFSRKVPTQGLCAEGVTTYLVFNPQGRLARKSSTRLRTCR